MEIYHPRIAWGVSIETNMQINGKGVETEETVKVKAEERR